MPAGERSTFTQTAVYSHFGHSVRALPCGTIDEVFQEVESGVADFGVVPIENSTEGTVNNTLDMFLTSPLKIGGEIELRIEQHLLGRLDSLENVERVCAHEQALAQCRGWLREYLPHVELIGVSSNAVGARRARDESGIGERLVLRVAIEIEKEYVVPVLAPRWPGFNSRYINFVMCKRFQ